MLFSKETIRSYAQSIGIVDIDDTLLEILANHIEYRQKEIVQDASKFMLKSRRQKLLCEDVNEALRLKHQMLTYGYDPIENLVFKQVNNMNFYYVPDEEVEIDTFLNQPLPKLPVSMGISCHWLAIEGVQPQIPQNPIVYDNENVQKEKKNTIGKLQEDFELRQQIRHVISKELELYYEKIISLIDGTDEEHQLACECMELEGGIQQLAPYFVQHFRESIIKSLNNTSRLLRIVELYFAFLKNKTIFIESYLHQIIPPVITCVVAKNLRGVGKDRNIELRRRASVVLKYIIDTYSHLYHSLKPRVINTLLKVWLNVKTTPESHFGALHCLGIIGEDVYNSIVRPNIPIYMKSNSDIHQINLDEIQEIEKRYGRDRTDLQDRTDGVDQKHRTDETYQQDRTDETDKTTIL